LLPGTSTARDVEAIGVDAFPRKDKPADTPSKITRINTLFSLNERMAPGPRLTQWQGEQLLMPGASSFEHKVR
jgi:hypothetical protein